MDEVTVRTHLQGTIEGYAVEGTYENDVFFYAQKDPLGSPPIYLVMRKILPDPFDRKPRAANYSPSQVNYKTKYELACRTAYQEALKEAKDRAFAVSASVKDLVSKKQRKKNHKSSHKIH